MATNEKALLTEARIRTVNPDNYEYKFNEKDNSILRMCTFFNQGGPTGWIIIYENNEWRI